MFSAPELDGQSRLDCFESRPKFLCAQFPKLRSCASTGLEASTGVGDVLGASRNNQDGGD